MEDADRGYSLCYGRQIIDCEPGPRLESISSPNIAIRPIIGGFMADGLLL